MHSNHIPIFLFITMDTVRVYTFLLLLIIFHSDVIGQTTNTSKIVKQPDAITIAHRGQSITMAFTVDNANNKISYQWFANTTNSNKGGTAIKRAKSSVCTTKPFKDKEIGYYYCTATTKNDTITSNVATVAFTGLPTVNIKTNNGVPPTARYAYPPANAFGRTITDATKIPSRMQIEDKDGKIIYDSGEFESDESGITIKIRGNASVNDLAGKTPYKLKLQQKSDLLEHIVGRNGNEYKNKDWVLLKDATSLKTFIGHEVAAIAGTPWVPHATYVDVVINGDYRGVYMLIESIGKGSSRIDVANDGFIVEQDAFWWNEDVYLYTIKYCKHYTVKYPGAKKIKTHPELLSNISHYMQKTETSIADGTYNQYIDTESFARWILVHDILGTEDMHGSNPFMFKTDNTDTSKLHMASNWDFDSIFKRGNTWSSQHNGSAAYAFYLKRSPNKSFEESYKAQWNVIKSKVWRELSSKLNNLKTQQGDCINLSRQLDAIKWKTSFQTIEENISEAENWFLSRIKWLEQGIVKPDF